MIYISESGIQERYGRLYIAQNATQIDPAPFQPQMLSFEILKNFSTASN